MERRGLVFGNAVVDLSARFPAARLGEIERRLDWNAPASISIQTSSFFQFGYGPHLCHLSEFFFESTVACFAMPDNGLGVVSFLVSQVGHLDPWVVGFLEMEIASFAHEAALAARRLSSHGFDMIADICVYWSYPVLEWEEEINEVDLAFYLHQGPAGTGEEIPSAVLEGLEIIDGLLVFDAQDEGIEGSEEIDGVPVFNAEEEGIEGWEEIDGVLVFSAGEEGIEGWEETDGVLILNPEEEGLGGAEGEDVHCDPATSSEIEQLETVNYRQDCDIHEEACPICMEEYVPEMELRRMRCQHVYHTHCLLRWLQERRVCPLCRTTIAARAEDGDRPSGVLP